MYAYEICLNVTFVNEKLKFASFSLFLDAPPPVPRCPLDNEMSLHIYTTYVNGVLVKGKKPKNTPHTWHAKWLLLSYINCTYIYLKPIVIGRLITLDYRFKI